MPQDPSTRVDRTRDLAARPDEHGSRHLWAELRGDGTLVIAGQDLSRGEDIDSPLAEIFGSGTTEYEYATSVAPADIPAVLELLGLDPEGEPLEQLATLSTDEAFTVTARVREHDLAHDRFSRFG